MRLGGRVTAVAGALFLATFAFSVCSTPAPSKRQSAAPATFGDMVPIVSVKELMRDMIDPTADNIFDAVWWDETAKGLVEHRPTSEQDWEKVRIGGVTIVEGIELLKMPRALAPAGDVNNSVGLHASELSPTAIRAKIDKDPVLWLAKIQALRNVGLEILDVVKKKDVDGLWQAGGDLEDACEACHLEYWYPGDKATVLAEKKARARFEKR
jgi:hypothetical protein